MCQQQRLQATPTVPAQRSIWTALLCQSYVKCIIAESNNSAVLSGPCSYNVGVNEINNTSFMLYICSACSILVIG